MYANTTVTKLLVSGISYIKQSMEIEASCKLHAVAKRCTVGMKLAHFTTQTKNAKGLT